MLRGSKRNSVKKRKSPNTSIIEESEITEVVANVNNGGRKRNSKEESKKEEKK